MSSDLVNARLLSVTLLGISVAVLLLVILPVDDAGELVLRGNPDQSRLLIDLTRLTLESYKDVLQLLVASFGVVSFVIGYQTQHRLELPKAAWTRLSVGVLLLAIALLLTLLGREKILTMLARDAVDLGAGSLLYLRWACYTAFAIAAVLVSSFGVAAANARRIPVKEDR
jgi:hypothetical protein